MECAATSPIVPRIRRAALVVAAAIASASCAAKVHQFHADPNQICPGTPVTVSWQVKGGSVSVRGDPPLEPQSGQTYVPPASMRFILTAKPPVGKAVHKEASVKVYTGTPSAPQSEKIGFEPKCQGGSVVQELARPAAGWDPKLTVGTLESRGTRTITIEHEGRQATLTPQAPSTGTFAGTQLGGNWKFLSPLLSSESCTGAGQKPPEIVTLTVLVRCGS